MASYPPPPRFKTDNLKRVHARQTTDALIRALSTLRGKSGMWPENDPEAYAAYIESLMDDPRLRPTRLERLPLNHHRARLRLDRCETKLVTVTCRNCRVS